MLRGRSESTTATHIQHEQHAAKLARRVAGLEEVLANLGEGVLAVDHAGIVIHANPAAIELLALDAGRVLGQHLVVAVPVAHVRDVLDDAMRSNSVVAASFVVDVSGAAGMRTVRIRVTPLKRDQAGSRPAGIIAVVSDITDVQRVERMRADFFTNVSHELKTPMAAIRGIVETMLDDPSMARDDRAVFLAKAVRQADRIDRLIADLISISRMESDPGSISRTPVDMVALVRDVVATVAHRAERAGVEISVDAPGSVVVLGDEESLRQAAANLLVNAITYTDAGGCITVEIEVAARAAGIVLRVIDTGIGIPEDAQQRIFERFFRVDPARSRERGGSGLGLSIVKHVARVHGGDVTVRSVPGLGSTFELVLPQSAAQIMAQ
jgi:two-component system phosphate regulon sensor histidine kinase PhoR